MNRIVLACRTKEKADYARKQVLSVLPRDETYDNNGEHIIALACDHCCLASVRSFVVELRRKLDETYRETKWTCNGIDALCLNAAVLTADGSAATYTKDGLETTFQTNHLSPFLIAYLTMDFINPGGRVIFSTSGLHLRHYLDLKGVIDPSTGAVQRGFEMMDGSDFHYKNSYSMAKLCNVAICAELHQRLATRGALSTCFSPGLMLDSGLFRHQPTAVHPVPESNRDDVLRKAKSVEWGATALAYMCWADEPGEQGAVYWRDESYEACNAKYGEHFSPISITEQTVDMETRKHLWEASCELAGVKMESKRYRHTVG